MYKYDFYRDCVISSFLLILIVFFLSQAKKNHRDQYNKHKLGIILYLSAKILFIIISFFAATAIISLDDSYRDTILEMFQLAFDFIIVFYKRDRDILISFSKLDNIAEQVHSTTLFHKPSISSASDLTNDKSESESHERSSYIMKTDQIKSLIDK